MSANVAAVNPDVVRRKVAWRILPLIFCLYVIAYLDRANAGYAKLEMKNVLGWTEDVFGWGFGIFFAGYLLLEIPGALLVEHWSARKWFARILVTWGICSMATAFVQTATHFYLARFMLGLAEAGFFPGVIVYFTHWFPRRDRARALSGMVLGIPVSLAFGSQFSGLILEHDWFWGQSWQWVFLIEGGPAVLLGLAVPFILTDRPRNATWLTQAERDWLESELEQERQHAAATGTLSLTQALKQPSLWLLALGILTTNIGGYALVFWLPTVMENTLKAQGGDYSPTIALNWTGLVYIVGLGGVLLSGQSSDRTGERKWHCVGGQVATGVFLAASVIPGQPFGVVMVWLCLMGFFSFFWPSPFWVLPTLSMSASAAAVSIGVINICANTGGLLGSPVVGEMKAFGWGDPACMIFLACTYLIGGGFVAALSVKKKADQSFGACTARASANR